MAQIQIPSAPRPKKASLRRDNLTNFLRFLSVSAAAEKSNMLDAAKEFSEPLAFDIATAMIDASNIPPALRASRVPEKEE